MDKTIYHGTILTNVISCLEKRDNYFYYNRAKSSILKNKEFYCTPSFDASILLGLRTSFYFNSPLIVLYGEKINYSELCIKKIWHDQTPNLFASFSQEKRIMLDFVKSRLIERDPASFYTFDLAITQEEYQRLLHTFGNFLPENMNPYSKLC